MNIPQNESVWVTMVTHDPVTGASVDADQAPVLHLSVNGGALVSQGAGASLGLGTYSWEVALSGYARADKLVPVVEAVVGGIPGRAVGELVRVIEPETPETGAAAEYLEGSVWLSDTGSPGTEVGVNGLPTNPVDSLEDALTLAAALGLHRIAVNGGIATQGNISLPMGMELWRYGTFASIQAQAGHTVTTGFSRWAGVNPVAQGGSFSSNAATYYDDAQVSTSAISVGTFTRCVMTGAPWSPGMNTGLFECSGTAPLTLTLGPVFFLQGYTGPLTLVGGNAATTYTFNGLQGALTIQDSFQAAQLIVDGSGSLDNQWDGNLNADGFFHGTTEPGEGEEGIGYSNAAVWMSEDLGSPGTEPGLNGTAVNPVDTLDDAKALCEALNLRKIMIVGSHLRATGGVIDLTEFTLEGWGRARPQVAVSPGNTIQVSNSVIRSLELQGLTGTEVTSNAGTIWHNCSLAGSGQQGSFIDCRFMGNEIAFGAQDRIRNCYDHNPLTCDLAAATAFSVAGYMGDLIITNAGGFTYRLDGIFGDVTIDASCSDLAVFELSGSGKLTNNSNAIVNADGYFDGTLSVEGLAEFATVDVDVPVAAPGSIAQLSQGSAGGAVTVGAFEPEALKQFATDDTEETSVAPGSVCELSRAEVEPGQSGPVYVMQPGDLTNKVIAAQASDEPFQDFQFPGRNLGGETLIRFTTQLTGRDEVAWSRTQDNGGIEVRTTETTGDTVRVLWDSADLQETKLYRYTLGIAKATGTDWQEVLARGTLEVRGTVDSA